MWDKKSAYISLIVGNVVKYTCASTWLLDRLFGITFISLHSVCIIFYFARQATDLSSCTNDVSRCICKDNTKANIPAVRIYSRFARYERGIVIRSYAKYLDSPRRERERKKRSRKFSQSKRTENSCLSTIYIGVRIFLWSEFSRSKKIR